VGWVGAQGEQPDGILASASAAEGAFLPRLRTRTHIPAFGVDCDRFLGDATPSTPSMNRIISINLHD